MSVLALVEGCVYQYTGEPPSELQCDPYSGGGQPTFECSVLVNTLVSAPTQLFQVVWYYEEEVANSGPVKLITFPFTEGEQEGGGGGGGEGGGAGGGGGGGGGGRVITQLTVSSTGSTSGSLASCTFVIETQGAWVRLTQKLANSDILPKYIAFGYSYSYPSQHYLQWLSLSFVVMLNGCSPAVLCIPLVSHPPIALRKTDT